MATSDIVSPSGLDLSPKPPNPVRVSKRAGFLFLGVGAIVAALIVYGIATRGNRQLKLGVQADETKSMTAATDAGRIISSKIAARPSLREGVATEELSSDAPQQKPKSGNPGRANTGVETQALQNVVGPPTPTQYRDLTPEERRRELAYQREMAALDAPTASNGGFPTAHEAPVANPPAQGDVAQFAQLLQKLQGATTANSTSTTPAISAVSPHISTGGTTQSQAEEYNLQNAQDEKESFLENARGRRAEEDRGTARVKPLSKYEIKAGWDIPAILEQALNSDLPGETRALVRENVYDTATGNYLLIPQGSRLIGIYDSRIAYGQDGVQVSWNRIIFPDASSINLDGMTGQDASGSSGLRHQVDKHYKRLVGTAILTSAFGAAFQLSQTRRGTVFTYPGPGEIVGSAAAGNLSKVGSEVTRRNLNVQPTIKVPIGYRFNVRVNRNLLFEKPYTPTLP
jgi:type IV secretion system protein VirB10